MVPATRRHKSAAHEPRVPISLLRQMISLLAVTLTIVAVPIRCTPRRTRVSGYGLASLIQLPSSSPVRSGAARWRPRRQTRADDHRRVVLVLRRSRRSTPRPRHTWSCLFARPFSADSPDSPVRAPPRRSQARRAEQLVAAYSLNQVAHELGRRDRSPAVAGVLIARSGLYSCTHRRDTFGVWTILRLPLSALPGRLSTPGTAMLSSLGDAFRHVRAHAVFQRLYLVTSTHGLRAAPALSPRSRSRVYTRTQQSVCSTRAGAGRSDGDPR